jgi:hypothetical protein
LLTIVYYYTRKTTAWDPVANIVSNGVMEHYYDRKNNWQGYMRKTPYIPQEHYVLVSSFPTLVAIYPI